MDKTCKLNPFRLTRIAIFSALLLVTAVCINGCDKASNDLGNHHPDKERDAEIETKRLAGVWKRMAKGSDGPSTEYLLFEEPQKDGKIRVGVALDKQKDEGIYGYTWMRFEVNHTFDDGRIVIFDDLYSAIPGTDYMPQVEFHFTSDGIAKRRENYNSRSPAEATTWFEVTDETEVEAVRKAMDALRR